MIFVLQFPGYLNSLIQLLCDYVIKTVSPETYKRLHNETESTIAAEPQTNWQQQQPNNLISNANQMAEANFNFTVKQ